MALPLSEGATVNGQVWDEAVKMLLLSLLLLLLLLVH